MIYISELLPKKQDGGAVYEGTPNKQFGSKLAHCTAGTDREILHVTQHIFLFWGCFSSYLQTLGALLTMSETTPSYDRLTHELHFTDLRMHGNKFQKRQIRSCNIVHLITKPKPNLINIQALIRR